MPVKSNSNSGKSGFLSFLKAERGAIAPLTALLLPVILGFAGLGVDASMWLKERRDLQTAADAAALAAAYQIANADGSQMNAAALREAQNNGYDPDLPNSDLVITYDEATGEVNAQIQQDSTVFLTGIFVDNPVVGTHATAILENSDDDEFCILGLDQVANDTVETNGNVTIDSPACGIAVNSNSDEALSFSGNSTINIGSIHVVGGYAESGSVDLTYNSLKTNTSAISDPYEDLDVPLTTCTSADIAAGPVTVNSGSDPTINPGDYCGGLKISGNGTVTFNPGTYVIDGGDFSVSGNGTMIMDGVSVIMTNSGGLSYGEYGRFKTTGGKEITWNAPTEDDADYPGVAFYQDRNTPEDTQRNFFAGNATIEINGALYTPSTETHWGGTADATGTEGGCIKLIGRIVSLSGTPGLQNECDGMNTLPITSSFTVRLIE